MKQGLSLIEIVISVALIAILAGLGLLALNPGGQLAGARNTQRSLHLQGIMNGVRQNIADSASSTLTCAAGPVPTSTTKMAVGGGNYDIGSCLIPIYLNTMPFDPSASGAHYLSNSDYDSGYNIVINASSGAITLSAPGAELGKAISITR